MTTPKSSPTPTQTQTRTTAEAFGRLVNLQELYLATEIKLAEMQSTFDAAFADGLAGINEDYIAHKTTRDEAEVEIKSLAAAHPEWKDGETIKTPFGTIQFRHTSKLEVANEERTLGTLALTAPEMAEKLTRTETTLNREALESLPDETLELLGVKRTTTSSITVKPARVDLGKAANPKTAKAEKTPKGKAAK
jgi:hypothetical protein